MHTFGHGGTTRGREDLRGAGKTEQLEQQKSGNQTLAGPQPEILPQSLLQQPILQPALPVKGQALNNLFKTQLCKHFQQSKQCVKGNGCHFAHGEAELRRKDEQLPVEVQYKMLNIPYNNYKTQVCKYFEQEKTCQYGRNCTYAHGEDELRKPYEELPTEAVPVTNLNAFRLLRAQVQTIQPSILPTQSGQSAHAQPKKSSMSRREIRHQIKQVSKLFQENRKEDGLKLLEKLLLAKEVTVQFPADPSQCSPSQYQSFSQKPSSQPHTVKVLPANKAIGGGQIINLADTSAQNEEQKTRDNILALAQIASKKNDLLNTASTPLMAAAQAQADPVSTNLDQLAKNQLLQLQQFEQLQKQQNESNQSDASLRLQQPPNVVNAVQQQAQQQPAQFASMFSSTPMQHTRQMNREEMQALIQQQAEQLAAIKRQQTPLVQFGTSFPLEKASLDDQNEQYTQSIFGQSSAATQPTEVLYEANALNLSGFYTPAASSLSQADTVRWQSN